MAKSLSGSVESDLVDDMVDSETASNNPHRGRFGYRQSVGRPKGSKNKKILESLSSQEKRCSCCKVVKPFSEFALEITRATGVGNYCKSCLTIRKRARKYHMTVGDYEHLFKKQSGLCAICNKPPEHGRQLCVDHCHSTGIIRGLLCDKCNRMLGQGNDDLDRLRKAIGYLQRFERDDLQTVGRCPKCGSEFVGYPTFESADDIIRPRASCLCRRRFEESIETK